MTLNQILALFRLIVDKHYQLNGFGFGPLFQINGQIKPGLKYPLLWLVPVDSNTLDQVKQRRFSMLVLDLVKSDLSNRDEVWSDTEAMADDVIKILRNESDQYTLIGDPQLNPVTEQFGDWVTGWQSDLLFETELNSNYCDIPAENLNTPFIIPGFAEIRNIETGELVTTLQKGDTYYIQILDTVEQSLDTVSPTIIQVLT